MDLSGTSTFTGTVTRIALRAGALLLALSVGGYLIYCAHDRQKGAEAPAPAAKAEKTGKGAKTGKGEKSRVFLPSSKSGRVYLPSSKSGLPKPFPAKQSKQRKEKKKEKSKGTQPEQRPELRRN